MIITNKNNHAGSTVGRISSQVVYDVVQIKGLLRRLRMNIIDRELETDTIRSAMLDEQYRQYCAKLHRLITGWE